MADPRPEDFGAVQAAVRPEDFGATPVATSAPAESNTGRDMAMAAMRGAPGGALGITASVGAMVTKALDEALQKGAYNAGGHVTDFLANMGASPPVAAGAGFATDVGIQAVPAVVGGGIGGKAAPIVEAGANKLMQSAIKPSLKDLQKGKVPSAIDTMFDEGINATKGGMEELRKRIGGINEKITGALASSNATIDKGAVASRIQEAIGKIEKTNPTPQDMSKAAERVYNQFLENGLLPEKLSVQQAQEFKKGLYKIIDEKYGQGVLVDQGQTAAQKALARGFKEELSSAVPEVAALNAQDSKLINALKVGERRALLDGNKNPFGLALLAHNPATWAAYMADKSALFKSLLARGMNAGSSVIPTTAGAATGAAYSIDRDRRMGVTDEQLRQAIISTQLN